MHRKALNHLRRADPVLARVIERVGPCRFSPRSDGSHFDALVRSIVYQQLSGSAASTIHARFLGIYEGGSLSPEQLLATSDEALRAVGLSRQKIAYMKDLAERVGNGDVPMHAFDELSDDAIIEALTRVKGVGRWTAQMFLMFRLGRPNVLPELDLGVRKAIQRAYRLRALPSTDRVREIGAIWEPYCTIASWYLWRSLEVDGVTSTPSAKRQGGGGGHAPNARRKKESEGSRKNGAGKSIKKNGARKSAKKSAKTNGARRSKR
jgi:DNA-3-methyladenine glycosylase II